ncbi:MAG: hypothetical protein J6I53_06075 [Treponema sp.]|nr:hypothetical protein [Treponema sp.]
MPIVNPSREEVQRYIEKWKKDTKSVNQAKCVKRLFTETYPNNDKLDEILVKVATLNDYYSTNILATYAVAEHIFSIKNIDERLKAGDMDLVAEIARNRIKGKAKNFYVFATKYFAIHNDNFPIYDSKVEKALKHFRVKSKKKAGLHFKNIDLLDYKEFCRVINDFRTIYNLQEFSMTDLDKYLWQVGKELSFSY